MRHLMPLSFFSDFDQDLERFLSLGSHGVREWKPAVDITEKDGHYLLSLDLPGVPKENIDIQVEDQTLTIKGERKSEFQEAGRRERVYGQFERSFTLPEDVDVSKIAAHYEHGVLNLAIPRQEELKVAPQKIAITDQKSEDGFWSKILSSSSKERDASSAA